MFNVLIVDDQKTSRDLMIYIVSEKENYRVVGTLDNADKSCNFCKNNRVDLVLMDLHTAGKDNGIINSEAIKLQNSNTKIIIVTFLIVEEHMSKAKNAGCEGFWYKDHSSTELSEVIEQVMAGEIVYPDKLPTVTVGLAKSSDFTKQELTILNLKACGYSHAEVCSKLNITRSTLNYHIGNLKYKTGYDDLLKLVVDVSLKKFIIAEEH